MVDRRLILARLLWAIVPPAYFGLQVWVVGAWPVPYDFLNHTISDLGWTTCTTEQRPGGVLSSCSPRHAWFNLGGIVLWVLLAGGGILLRGRYDGDRVARWIIGLWVMIAGFGIATCLVPGDVNIGLHSLLAIPLFIGTIAVLFLSARALRWSAPTLGRAASVTAMVSLLGLAGLIIALSGTGPVGLFERLAAETVYLWVFVVAVFTGHRPAGTRPGLSRG